MCQNETRPPTFAPFLELTLENLQEANNEIHTIYKNDTITHLES